MTCDLILETHEEFIRIRSGIERLMLPVIQDYGLTPTQVAVLNLIRKTDTPTVSKLFKILDFNQGNMSSLCKRLEADGFIKKTKCKNDERKSYLSLSEKGEAALLGIDSFLEFSDEESWLSHEEFEKCKEAVSVLRDAARIINERLAESVSEKTENQNA